MSIKRFHYDRVDEMLNECPDGPMVHYEDHAELMTDLQRRLDETEALLAEATRRAEYINRCLERAECDATALEEKLNGV